ncbi:aminodeoxychorismate synthase component I [Psychrosphaera haliotis]|uniref:aminodeoxychorismate synthase n=1 Tax=Psychrosphaera haliotis TaxID=555083 RepID=A0A6N8F5I3_9GAMM|nr:aminodeoxychorismate synthase component I [Psychrosphaera haliotis]MUH71906.1 aminodeoxychorismate synthase component I [Psychrosphaera haliotis]
MSQSVFRKALSLSNAEFQRVLMCLQENPSFVFLDSANSSSENKGFSLCVWSPAVLLKTFGDVTQITKPDGNVTTSNEDPLTLIEQSLQAHNLKFDSSLPFSGGAVGFWGYELGGHFEPLPKPKPHDITIPDMAVGIYLSGLVINHENGKINYFSQSLQPEDDYQTLLTIIDNRQFEQIPSQSPNKVFALTNAWQSNMTFLDYQTKFNAIQAYLQSGDCYQVNLAQRFCADYTGSEWQAYLKLREQNKAPFSSFMRLEEGAILSVSPERFLQVTNKLVETKPIKGTRPRGKSISEDKSLANELFNATKDRAENLMIVDLLRNDIAKVSKAGSVKVPKLFDIESYPAVHHLVSTVTSELKHNASSIDLLRGAFPGGSITGAPKIRAMEVIHELEPHPRSAYCGSIGYIKPNGDMDTNITIRTLVCSNNRIYCWAGGGLVADSKCEDEYQETLDKVNKILPTLTEMTG